MMVHTLCEKIKKSKIKFNAIYGIPRGGLIPAVILSHYFNVNLVNNEDYFTTLNSTGETVLVVDDIIDTSKTIKEWVLWFGKKEKVYTATLFKHRKCAFKPNFYVEKTDRWVVFPYEKD
jgi:hypoxanthine phosphoribosyltransferase